MRSRESQLGVSPDRWTVIYPLQWPGSGQTARPRAAMLPVEMA